MSEQVYCRYCDYNPCLCGRREYMTERERQLREREEYEKRCEEDAWAMPPAYGEGVNDDD
jgi:hypothetical protein